MTLPILFFLVAGMLVYSLSPLLGPRRPLAEVGEAARRRIDALESEKTGYLQAIKDVEFERAIGKLSEEDYEGLRSVYTRKASEALDALREETDRDGSSS